jgi:hypothetical protein
MIDVPVQVKDVLREGNTLKNYRFEVLKEAEKRDTITVLETLTAENTSYVIPSNGNYILYNEEDYHAFEYVEVIGAAAQSEVCCWNN